MINGTCITYKQAFSHIVDSLLFRLGAPQQVNFFFKLGL